MLSITLTWLLSKQNTDGSFREDGDIVHENMQSATAKTTAALTAFVVIAVTESTYLDPDQSSETIKKATHYLEQNIIEQDLYTLALVCYALTKVGSQSCFTSLQSHATVTTDGLKYWKSSESTDIKTKDIEGTAYALLTYIEVGETAEARPIFDWLVSQRKSGGGFSSTQETVVALQAMSEYSSRYHFRLGSEVTVTITGNMGFTETVSVNQQNVDVIQEVEIPDQEENLTFDVSGDGIVLIDVSRRYYVEASRTDDSITVSTTIVEETLDRITVRACTRWRGDQKSGMLLMEVEMITGFIADTDYLATQPDVKLHDVRGRFVAIYFEGAVKDQQQCANVRMDRVDPVVKSQQRHVIAYDYYEPSRQAVALYASGILKEAEICHVCPDCGFCVTLVSHGE